MIEIRPPHDAGELREGMQAAVRAFADTPEEEDYERELATLPPERALVAVEDGRTVGLAGAYKFDLTIPGGQLPCAGVTWVGVQPTHRRRGVLREFMTRQFADARSWGEPIAALWASESAIYGRFGYGIAAPSAWIKGDRARFSLRGDPEPAGRWHLLTFEEALSRFPPIYERVRQVRPGFLTRNEHWWREHRLADPERWRRGASEKYYAVLELDGEDAGYAVYRVKNEWEEGFPRGEVRVMEAFTTSPLAERELWRYLFGVDLTVRVEHVGADPGAPVFLMVRDPRALQLRVHDGLWLRFVDLEAALAARSYRPGDSVVIEVHDELCPWNAGRYRVGETVERTDAEPDLVLDVADLASVYLGAFDFVQLARADRVDVRTAGAAERASDRFRTFSVPWCPEIF